MSTTHITKTTMRFVPEMAQIIEVTVWPTWELYIYNSRHEEALVSHCTEGSFWAKDLNGYEIVIRAEDLYPYNLVVVTTKNSHNSMWDSHRVDHYRVKADHNADGLVTRLWFEPVYFELMGNGYELPDGDAQ